MTATPTPSCDVGPYQVLSYTITGTGTTTTAGAPAGQSFTWTLQPSRYSNSNGCAFTPGKRPAGDHLAGQHHHRRGLHLQGRDAHSWAIKGQVTDSTNSAFPPTPVTPSSGVVGYPPNPCTGGAVSATISLYPPVPS